MDCILGYGHGPEHNTFYARGKQSLEMKVNAASCQ